MSKYLAEVSNALVIRFEEKGEFKKEIHFFIPKEPTTYPEDTRTQNWRFVLENLENLVETGFSIIATPNQPLRLPSGGCLDVITDSSGKKFIPMEQRDIKPGIRAPGFQNPWLGYPENLEECLSGNHGRRESNEEAIFSRSYLPVASRYPNLEGIYTWQKKLLVPPQEFERAIIIETARKLNLALGLEELKMEYDETTPRDVYSLYQNKKRMVKINCSFTWYPTPDLIQLRRIHLPVTIEEILIYHGIGRDILVVEAEKLKDKIFGDELKVLRMTNKNGERVVVSGKVIFKPTSSLKGILNQLGIYPYDWVEEVGNLLSNPEYQKLLVENPDVDPFTLEGILWERGKHP